MQQLPPEFRYIPAVFTEEEAGGLVDALVASVAWEDRPFRIFGKELRMPRRIAFFGPIAYRYSGIVHAAAPLPDLLLPVRARVEALAGRPFNTVLLNLYRDGRDSMGWHHDADYDHGGQPMIASVSLGAARRFVLRSRQTPERWALELEPGSLLIMGDDAQARYLHAVPKTTQAVGPRLNLTWRYMATGG